MGSIYMPGPTENCQWCNPVLKEDFERIVVDLNGVPQGTKWKPMPVKLMLKARRYRVKYSDSPWSSESHLIFRRPAIEKMKSLLEAYGELLPLECPDAELWVYNPTVVIDALDDDATVSPRLPSGKRVMIEKYVFHANRVAGVDIFKLPRERSSPTFVSDKFVDLWNSSGLQGLTFTKLWSSDETT